MKLHNLKYLGCLLTAAGMIGLASCSDREVDSLDKASQYATTPEVFTDAFSANEDLAAWGKTTNFNLDYNTVYSGSASIRIDVPSETDPAGTWAGGNIFTSVPRDLSSYDCLTFYAKSTVATTMIAGYGVNSDYVVTDSVPLTTTWTKYYIPIPVAAKLTAMSSMFNYSAAPVSGSGYSIYIDDIKYEKLGTIAHKTIINNLPSSLFLGKTTIGNVSMSASLPNGGVQRITASPSYFDFSSTDTTVATVSGNTINVVGAGAAQVKATGFEGSLTVSSTGIGSAPTPTYPADSVLSVYSDAYSTSYVYDFWAGSTKITQLQLNGNNMFYFTSLDWTCMVMFNSAGAGYPDASGYKYLHIDIMTPNDVTTASSLRLELANYATGVAVTPTIYTYTMNPASKLTWIQLDIPISAFPRNKVGFITFAGTNLTNLYVDNVFFHN